MNMGYNERKVKAMNKRDIKLLEDYGPRFMERSGDILTECLHLATDAYSVMTDEEWKECAEAMTAFENELTKIRRMVYKRMKENGVEW